MTTPTRRWSLYCGSLPGVVKVEVGVAEAKPTSRIIHLRDWYDVPKGLHALDMKSAHGRELTGGVEALVKRMT